MSCSDPEKILKDARMSISKFCSAECNAFCCRKGFIKLDQDNVNLVTQGKKAELIINQRLLEKEDLSFSLSLKNDCPSLFENKCLIHKNVNRPKMCKEFPIFLCGKEIILSARCPAAKSGLLYPYVCKLLKLGLNLADRNVLSDVDTDFSSSIST